MDHYHFARIGYEAFRIVEQEAELPPFDELPDHEKEAWREAAVAISEETVRLAH